MLISQPYTVARILQQATQMVPRLDAELLLAHVLQKDRAWLHAHPEDKISFQIYKYFQTFLKKCQEGQPIAYLLGYKEFWSMEFLVNPHVLIPRPETELLVQAVLERYSDQNLLNLADLGTGSGAIAVAFAKERPHWQIYATDRNPLALETARQNADKNRQSKIHFSLGYWCQALPIIDFDIIVSNPPYIAPHDPHLLKDGLQYEPQSALIAEDSGLADIKIIAKESWNFLKEGGSLWVEHGFDQFQYIHDIFQKIGYKEIIGLKDLNGNHRVVSGLRKA